MLSMERLYQHWETFAIGSFSAPRSDLAAAAVNESMKQELHTTHYTTTSDVSHRPVFSHHTTKRFNSRGVGRMHL